ncbi:MAG TPA: GYD domain-containing protein [Casimicrobiaceae bacterium]|nr:GYD domain-containing protein [Casimicrobiaceae bacterium]
MALYALQTSYTQVGWAALLASPENRLEAVRPVVERLGGSIVDGWFTFGEHDLLIICKMPDNVSAAALSMAVSAGGAIKAAKTSVLLTFDEGVEALRKAKSAEYLPPPTEIPYFGTCPPEG